MEIKELLFGILVLTPAATGLFGKVGWFKTSDHLTVCGRNVSDNAPVASLGPSHWTTLPSDQDPMCEAILRVMDPVTGKQVIVAVVDKCAKCEPEDVQISMRTFQQFRKLVVGNFIADWEFLK